MNHIFDIIKKPIQGEMSQFDDVFSMSLQGKNGLLSDVLSKITSRKGKRMRPVLVMLMYKAFASGNEQGRDAALHSAAALELLHTASLVHDDVVDESNERRGQSSVNAAYSNKIAVLVGDFILSTSLQQVAKTHDTEMVNEVAELGRILSEGEVIQLENVSNTDFSIDRYFDIITKKTASLFETCCYMGAKAAGASDECIKTAREFGRNIGIIFQIRDDIFDYDTSFDTGKPHGNDMHEGKLTLPVLTVLNESKENAEIQTIAKHVKSLTASDEEISKLVRFTIENNGIEKASAVMNDYYRNCIDYINKTVSNSQLAESLTAYVDYVLGREK